MRTHTYTAAKGYAHLIPALRGPVFAARVVGLSACLAICDPSQAPAQTRADAVPIAVAHVTVIDVASGQSRPDQTIIIIRNRIARLGPSGKISVPRAAKIIDGRQKFVIPGLWDMHVHLFRHSTRESVDVHERYFPLFLANGVTGVRDMWTSVEDFQTVRRWRRDEAVGTLLGPRVAGSSTVVDGVPTIWPRGTIGVTTAAEARRVVDSLVRGGAEFIKVYTRLPREAYFAIVDESKRLGVPFAGHLPLSIRAAEASDAGQKSIEHLGFMDDCSTARDRIVQLRQDTTLARPEGGIATLALETYSDSLCATLFRRFVRNGTWQVPTLVVLRQSTLAFDTLMLDPHLRYATDEERTAWETQTRAISQRTTPRQAEVRRRSFQKSLDIVVGMQRAGVPILAGTDVANPWLVAGFSLHDELALFVQAGMPPLAALQTATINPARYLGALDSLGTIAEGKIADLELLDANPLEDIRNTRRIRAVVANGHLLIRAALDSLLATVQETPPSIDDSPLVEKDFSCLPSNVKPADVVSAELSRGDRPKLVTVTVEDTLKQLRARCVRGTLIDGNRREVRFYPVHCFGSPTPYMIETMRRERAELEALRKRYRVIEMSDIPQPCA